MGIFEWKNHPYLLIVDYYSRGIEISHLRQTTSSTVTEHIKSIFARHGIPEIAVSDNGPQVSSWDFYSLQSPTASPILEVVHYIHREMEKLKELSKLSTCC